MTRVENSTTLFLLANSCDYFINDQTNGDKVRTALRLIVLDKTCKIKVVSIDDVIIFSISYAFSLFELSYLD